MRISFFTVLPAAISLVSWTAGFARAQGNNGPYHNHPSPRSFLDDDLDFALQRRAFDLIDELTTREVLAELTTRELVDELADRLERRGNVGSKIKEAVKPKKKYGCPYCGAKYDTPELAKACATKPQILGGCKVMGAVRH